MATTAGFTALTSFRIQDSSASVLGSGFLSIIPTDGSDRPISAVAGGVGGPLTNTPAIFPVSYGQVGPQVSAGQTWAGGFNGNGSYGPGFVTISNGAYYVVTGNVTLGPGAIPDGNANWTALPNLLPPQAADTTMTKPPNISYRITIQDADGNPIYTLKGVQPSGPTFNLDTYLPNVAQQAIIQYGPAGANGLSAYQVYLTTVPAGTTPLTPQVWASSGLTPSALSAQIAADISTALGGTPGGTAAYPFGNASVSGAGQLGSGLWCVPITSAWFAPQSGPLTSVSVNISALGGQVEVIIVTLTAPNGDGIQSPGSITDRFFVTPTALGVNTFTAGTDFPARNIAAGQVLGFGSASSATGMFVGSGASSSIFYTSGSPPSGTQTGSYSFLGGGAIDISGVVTLTTAGSGPSLVTTAAVQALINTSITSLNYAPLVTPWLGKNWVNFGDSYSANFANVWQNVVVAELQVGLFAQYAYGGRTLNQDNSVGGTGNWIFEEMMTSGAFDPTKLAAALAGKDLVTIAFGANDASEVDHNGYPLGTPTDAAGTAGWCGSLRYAIEAMYTANPSVKVVCISTIHIQSNQPYISGDFAQWFSDAAADNLIAAQKIVCASYGVPVIDMAHNIGINKFNVSLANGSPLMLRDKLHPTDATFEKYYAPLVTRGLLGLPIV